MGLDITATLIQTIGANDPDLGGLQTSNDIGGSSADLLGAVADWVQVGGPLAAALGLVGAAAGVIGGLFGLFIGVMLGFITGDSSDSQQAEAFAMLYAALEQADNDILGGYWATVLNGALSVDWGPVQTALDDIAGEGLTGPDVANGVDSYHDNAQTFCNLFLNSPAAPVLWSIPSPPPTGSGAGFPPWLDEGNAWNAGYAYFTATQLWYGLWLGPEAAAGGSVNIQDPRTMLPVMTLGLQSYLALASLLHAINPAQLTLEEFVDDFRQPELEPYLDLVRDKYLTAVRGIQKTATPGSADVLSFLYLVVNGSEPAPGGVMNPGGGPFYWGGSEPSPSGVIPIPGVAWNGVYGAAETYPVYGVYPPPTNQQAVPPFGASAPNEQPPGGIVNLSVCSPAYFLTLTNANQLVVEFDESETIFGSNLVIGQVNDWVVPWVQNRSILGTLARWKAIYLVNGFAEMWNTIRSLWRVVSTAPTTIPSYLTLEDGTFATGDWSVRELCRIVEPQGQLLAGNSVVTQANSGFVTTWQPPSGVTAIRGPSVSGLLQFLDNIANGNWGGPPEAAQAGGQKRPLSFRDLLAGAAA